ncbi:MAG: tetratricopeptide repeat protein [Pseudonocardiaceae bacterium]
MDVDRRSSGDAVAEQDQWRVRVRDGDGAVLGAGILLGTRYVLTCAHVLLWSDAPDRGTANAVPDVEVIIDFVGLHPVRSARAKVTDGGWVPPNDTDGGDVVLLELDAPAPIGSTAPLRRLPVTRGRAVYTCGFPRGLKDGMWVNATLSGPCGPGGEWVQMDATSAGGPVRAGFSGAPVFDNVTQCVIGMMVGAYTDEESGISYLLPVETILRHLPGVSEWVRGAKAADPSLIRKPRLQDLDNDLARDIVSWMERRRGTENIQIIVTGDSDTPGSATVRHVINLADREQRPNSANPLVAQAPQGTIPPPGGMDLAVDVTGKTPAEVFQRIADRAGIPVGQSTELTAQLRDSLPPMTIVVAGVDDAEQPEALLADVLEPLAERGHRLLLTFSRASSHSLTVARSWTDSVPQDPGPDTRPPVQPSTRTWMCADLVPLPVLDLPDPATRILTNPRVAERGRTFSVPPTLSADDLVADQYEVVGALARGGLGWVYLARDTHLDGNYVALKGLINTNDARAVALAVSERRFLTTLDHPNIVRIFNFVTHTEPHSGELTDYIVMEYVGGLPLDEVKDLAARHQDPLGGPLLVEHVIAYGIEILAAFEYLHGHGLLYCDMKPNNVIRSANRIKIIDLGAARGIDDRQSPIVGTQHFQVSREEIRTRGLTVQSDIHTVGKTLEELFSVTADVLKGPTEPHSDQVSFGIESFRRVLERATHERPDSRFPSAAAMAQQLKGVLREVLSLRDRQPRPEPSAVFTATATLLDAGLGMVPPLDSWTANRAAEHGTVVLDGRPSAVAAAVGLPAPQVDEDDPAASFLTEVSATDSRRLIDKLAEFPRESVAIQLCECRAHLELGDLEKAQICLRRAEEILGQAVDYDWRSAWHHGLLALTNDKITDAELNFSEVYRALPGEDVPKLALGFCHEQLGNLDDSQHYYEAVWRRDRSQASAAFGLARICLRRGARNDAVTILDEVPGVSRHYDAARIAAVRILSGSLAAGSGNGFQLPTAADFSAVVSRLPALYLDGGDPDGAARERLTAAVREVALGWVRETGGDEQLNGQDILGDHPSERKLRKLLAGSYRALSRQARNSNDHGILIDLANTVRPRTPW